MNETERAIVALREENLAVRGLVANKLTPSPDPDETGRGGRYLRERVETEATRLETIRSEFDPPLVAEIGWRSAEITGDLLADVADELDIETAAEQPTHV
ncbi:arsenite-activated ATPase ArsA [Natrinema pallidum DSM 3751]|uniref:Arsenite-activated ATPase ArsA n=1 Tax=Natrinema pallidum DSM 3751 TaxID=1227495 RepID=L9YRQ2_9EURY|nr:arsenite-activated ATPase ArsA [Natrinema pallidum DSM 3751]